MRVVFGPRENRSRPSIDPLFRMAAVHHRTRAIGVILTGLLGDGAAGLLAIARCGGVPVVQAPDDAAFPEMPRQALRHCRVGHASSPQDWLSEQGTAVEDSLWVALQTLEERARMLDTMARESRQRSPDGEYAERARETRMHAERLRELLAHLPA